MTLILILLLMKKPILPIILESANGQVTAMLHTSIWLMITIKLFTQEMITEAREKSLKSCNQKYLLHLN
jgi:hypothetical protein